jgi:hypothetical protein
MNGQGPAGDARWLAPLKELAERRGDPPGVAARAAGICRQLRVSPWIGLGIAEHLISLDDAAVLDRAARCKHLEHAVLDQRRSLDELRKALPFAPYLLAADLVEHLHARGLGYADALEISRGLLARERPVDADGMPTPVRGQPLATYAASAEGILRLREQEGLDLRTAIEVVCEGLDPRLARRLMGLKRRRRPRRGS